MTDVVSISPVEHELAKLMVEYGPKWGMEVSRAVEVMALAGEAVSESSTTGSMELQLTPVQPSPGEAEVAARVALREPGGSAANPGVTYELDLANPAARAIRQLLGEFVTEQGRSGAAIRQQTDKLAEAQAGPEEEHEVVLHAERPAIATEAIPVEKVRLGTDRVTEMQDIIAAVRKEQSGI